MKYLFMVVFIILPALCFANTPYDITDIWEVDYYTIGGDSGKISLILKNIWQTEIMSYLIKFFPFISPFIAAFLTYYFVIRQKKKDIEIQKQKELNTILSNMLNTWHYLRSLNIILQYMEQKSTDILLPVKNLSRLFLKYKILNDSCFDELEKSIDNIKQYSPIKYFELEGIGRKFKFFMEKCILPILQTNKKNIEVEMIVFVRKILDKFLNDIENCLRDTASLIPDDTSKKIERKIKEISKLDFEETKEEINREIYELIISSLSPDEVEKLSYEQFKQEIKTSEGQKFIKLMEKALESLVNNSTKEVEKKRKRHKKFSKS